jgi:hypothetical protein
VVDGLYPPTVVTVPGTSVTIGALPKVAVVVTPPVLFHEFLILVAICLFFVLIYKIYLADVFISFF